MVRLSKTMGFSGFDSVSFLSNKIYGLFETLKLHNSFQN